MAASITVVLLLLLLFIVVELTWKNAWASMEEEEAAARRGVADGSGAGADAQAAAAASVSQLTATAISSPNDPRWERLEGQELESQLAPEPSDTEETAHLAGAQVLLSDFCVSSRDLVLGSMRRSLGDLKSRVMRIFFGAFSKLHLDSRAVSEELEKQAEVGANVKEEKKGEEEAPGNGAKEPEVGRAEEDGGGGGRKEEEHKRHRLPLLDIIMFALNAIKNSLGHAIKRHLSLVRNKFGLAQVKEAAAASCRRITRFRSTLEARFRGVKEELKKVVAEASEFEAMQLEDVKCITVRNLLNLAGVCEFGKRVASHPLFSLLSTGHQVGKLIKAL